MDICAFIVAGALANTPLAAFPNCKDGVAHSVCRHSADGTKDLCYGAKYAVRCSVPTGQFQCTRANGSTYTYEGN